MPDSDSSTSRSAPSVSSSGHDGDVEGSSCSDTDDDMNIDVNPNLEHPKTLPSRIYDFISSIYAERYHEPRTRLPRPNTPFIHHVLAVYKTEQPELFRNELRVSPWTFDQLLAHVASDPIFANNSRNPQFPVEQQLAIALWRFGHYGNAAGLQKVANWAGVGKGYVLLATRRVVVALTRRDFLDETICMPTAEEKDEAKEWVEQHSCKAWRDGWLLVDGTLVPLYMRPYWYGESYYDRKCQYSLNIQVVSLPNLRIVDVSYGHTGSTHDSTAFERTRVARDYTEILEANEFIWADSAYPVSAGQAYFGHQIVNMNQNYIDRDLDGCSIQEAGA
ncbi:hypothetical protein L226DRAFT_466844 [Lentinus tigrinus ALCF2SS1-7]|nr:hypothetical protein L226DRAFT_466844 [Lentinus tigrinus ALCF2SS1-7]